MKLANKVISCPLNGHRIPDEHQIKVVCYCEVEYLGMFILDLKMKMRFGKMKIRLNDKNYHLRPLVTHNWFYRTYR